MSSRYVNLSYYAAKCGVSRAALDKREKSGYLVIDRTHKDATGKVRPVVDIEAYPAQPRMKAGRPVKSKTN